MSCHVRLWLVPGRTACRQPEGVDRGAVTARAMACQHVAALRVAAVYDIHANVPALEAALAEVERVSVDRIVIGGDVVSLRATRAALGGALVLVVAILLAGGAGSALAAPSCAPSGADTVCTFSTPGADRFTVPGGVTEASFYLFGAQGGGLPGQSVGGLGGRASAELALTPGAPVTVVVGGAGGSIGACDAQETPGAGGVNGGARGGSGFCEGGGGGGASDVRMGGSSLSDRVLVAGGGGGGRTAVRVWVMAVPVGV